LSFEAALAAADGVEGWLTDAQARRLFERAGAGGRIVEVGSFRGRSAIVMARAAGENAELVAIDPHAGGDRGPREIAAEAERGHADFEAFHANLARAGVEDRVRHVRRFSADALGDVDGPLDLLYVDGAHRYGPARDDLARWGARVRPGGHLLVHDAFSAVGVTLALLRLMVPGREFRYLGRTGSLAEYRRDALGLRERLVNAGRQLAELPWFARNLALKAAIVLRLRRGPWPY
jgi:predicted O-methyltransferase YrrM